MNDIEFDLKDLVKRELRHKYRVLSNKDMFIMKLLYVEELSFKDTARFMNLSSSRIHQIHDHAIRILFGRYYLKSKKYYAPRKGFTF